MIICEKEDATQDGSIIYMKNPNPKRTSAIRNKVWLLPLLQRVQGGEGSRFEIKVDVTPTHIAICGQTDEHKQASDSREFFDRACEDSLLAANGYLTEMLMRSVREVPKPKYYGRA